ncbi:response regulator [Rhizobium sp. TRM95111]|uniref:response regulator n=1 Tax=Rhizobium alarense TaxID=2846851 RepID=UPI001F1A8EE2|nr:response regulator [Rhizobium alarense]MCF3639596.1 response regulator [Rhizobium alarense]
MTDGLIDVLIVEDNEIDTEAVRRAFRRADFANPTHSACDGEEALDMLRGSHGRPKLPQPCLILLDINMPRMDGITLLEELRDDAEFKKSIVFMLTTSGYETDRKSAYEKNVAGYFLKENLGALVETLKPYCRGNEFPC